MQVKGRRKKNIKVADWSVNGGGGCYKREKDAECCEMKKYKKYICDIFSRVFGKNLDIFPDIFMKYWYFPVEPAFFSFIRNICFRPFWIF